MTNWEQADACAENGNFLEAKQLYQALYLETEQPEAAFYTAAMDLSLGNIKDAALALIALYHQGELKKEILSLLKDVFLSPNRDALQAIYQKNRLFLDQLYPECYLPEQKYLPYRLLPVTEDFFCLFAPDEERFYCEKLTPEQAFYVALCSTELDALPPDYEQALYAVASCFKKQAQLLYGTIEVLIKNQTIPETALFAQIELFEAMNPYDGRGDYLRAKYLFHHEQYQRADSYIKKALKYNKFNVDKLFLQLAIYQKTGNLLEEGRLVNLLQFSYEFPIDKQEVETLFANCVSRAAAVSTDFMEEMLAYTPESPYFPKYQKFSIENNAIVNHPKLYFARFLPCVSASPREWEEFVALGSADDPAVELAHTIAMDQTPDPYHYFYLKPNIQKSKSVDSYFIKTNGGAVVVPVAGLAKNQKIKLQNQNGEMKVDLQIAVFQYLRIEQDTFLASDTPFLLGKPVPLNHHPKRKKLVLTIFLDTVSHRLLKDTGFANCPNLKRFFMKGTIFDRQYSIGEYTLPVYPSLHTGLYSKKHQIFNRPHVFLDEDIKTIEELFQEEGYYCTAFTCQNQQVMTDSLRGFDKTLCKWGHMYQIQEMVRDVIEHLDAFSECDNFVWLSNSDVHRVIEGATSQLSSQTKKRYEEMYKITYDSTKTSVFQPKNDMKIQDYHELISVVDQYLGLLFSYIESHYKEDEYLVSVISDHGATLLTEEEWLLKDIHSRTLFMLRGAGVPERGFVTDEMTSVLDFLPSMCHLCGVPYQKESLDGTLPKALGGDGRTYTVTESRYPGQTYKLSIRDSDYEFRLETAAYTTYEGKVDLTAYKTGLFTREESLPVQTEPETARRFMRVAYRYLREYLIAKES